MIDTKKGILVKVDMNKLRKFAKIRAHEKDTNWSKMCELNGISSGWAQNCVYSYGRRETDNSGVYGYADIKRFKKFCKIFDLIPSNFCEEWDEYLAKYEPQPEIKEAEQLTLTVEQPKKAETDAELLKALQEIGGNLAEINANLVRLGNVQMQILEKMQKPIMSSVSRPAATLRG